MHFTAGAGSFDLDIFYGKYHVYIDVVITNLNWFSYTGMYIDHTVFNHCVQNM